MPKGIKKLYCFIRMTNILNTKCTKLVKGVKCVRCHLIKYDSANNFTTINQVHFVLSMVR